MKALSPTQQREFVLCLKMAQVQKQTEKAKAVVSDCDSREAALKGEDKTYLTQASTSYAPKVGAVQAAVPKEPATSSAPRYGSKFNQ